MALRNTCKTEHSEHKGSGRKSGFWGTRVVAKAISKKLRRELDKQVARDAKRNQLD